MSFKRILCYPHIIVMKMQALDFIGPLLLRVYLAYVFWMAGSEKIFNLQATAEWFGNAQQGLGLPFPYFFASLAGGVELLGCFLLLLGLGVRYIVIPLMCTMLVAIFAVHLDNGWFAIANSDAEAVKRLGNLLDWLKENYPMRFKYTTELGRPVVLNNGIEFAVTYLIMLISLFFTGAGKYFSVDYWLSKRFCCKERS